MKKPISVFISIFVLLIILVLVEKSEMQGRNKDSEMNRAQERAPVTKAEDKETLRTILKKTAEYCEKVKRVALNYVCIENITNKIFYYKIRKTKSFVAGNVETGIPESASTSMKGFSVSTFPERKKLSLKRTKRVTYEYDYQLIKKKGEFTEKRILLKENGRERNVENADLKTRFKTSSLVFGPVGFLSKYWQRYFDFVIEGQEKLEEKETIIIKATPTEKNTENRNFAKIWVDAHDYSILQIEWEPESIVGYVQKKRKSEAEKLQTNIIWKVGYGIEKNGVRFPSKQHFKEFYIGYQGRKYTIEEISFVYDDYKFFTVETEVKY